MMMKGKISVTSALIVLTALIVPAGTVQANHVKIDVNVDPYQWSSTPPAPMSQTLQADVIKAHQVRAHSIYANRIEADEVRGLVHETSSVTIRDTRGEIKAPKVSATVIYADTITANSVVAEAVYVRELRRR
jgi:hypothetical protein